MDLNEIKEHLLIGLDNNVRAIRINGKYYYKRESLRDYIRRTLSYIEHNNSFEKEEE